MNVHVVKTRASRPHHAAGEVVWAHVGNYLENPNCDAKARPVVILKPTSCQHWAAPLTTQATFKTTGEARVLVPVVARFEWHCNSYLWSARPSRVCRLDVRSHIGWVSREVADLIARHMSLPWYVLSEFRAAVAAIEPFEQITAACVAAE